MIKFVAAKKRHEATDRWTRWTYAGALGFSSILSCRLVKFNVFLLIFFSNEEQWEVFFVTASSRRTG